jgi:hypothetical protein
MLLKLGLLGRLGRAWDRLLGLSSLRVPSISRQRCGWTLRLTCAASRRFQWDLAVGINQLCLTLRLLSVY